MMAQVWYRQQGTKSSRYLWNVPLRVQQPMATSSWAAFLAVVLELCIPYVSWNSDTLLLSYPSARYFHLGTCALDWSAHRANRHCFVTVLLSSTTSARHRTLCPLQHNGYSPTGNLFKALDGNSGNLRYDIPTAQLHFFYSLVGGGASPTSKGPPLLRACSLLCFCCRETLIQISVIRSFSDQCGKRLSVHGQPANLLRVQGWLRPGSDNATEAAAFQILKDFMVGISGGGPVPRSAYAFDYLNLPTVRVLGSESSLHWHRCEQLHNRCLLLAWHIRKSILGVCR